MSNESEYFCVTYEEHTNVVEDTYGDEGPYTGFYQSELSHEIKDVLLSGTGNFCLYALIKRDFDAKAGEDVFVVFVKYSTGGSFERTDGALCIVDVCKDYDAAQKVADSCEKNTHPRSHIWTGHFESFESVDIEKVMVKNK